MNKVKVNTVLAILAFFVITISSCTRYDYIKGNHDVITQSRSTNSFDGILTEGSFNVEYIYDTAYALELEGESNLLDYVVTEVKGNTLNIRQMKHVSLREHSTITVFCYGPYVNMIESDGSGSVYFDTLVATSVDLITNGSGDMVGSVDSDQLYTVIRGSGNIILKGEAKDSELRIEGSGEIDAFNCEQEDCDARVIGSGDIYTFVTDHLDARIDGSGSIYYKGNPTINTIINGSGQVTNN
jgi:hypothetical protein